MSFGDGWLTVISGSTTAGTWKFFFEESHMCHMGGRAGQGYGRCDKALDLFFVKERLVFLVSWFQSFLGS